MAKITGPQDIPSALLQKYYAALGIVKTWKETQAVARRYPWRLPHCQGNGILAKDPTCGASVSDAMWQQRAFFKRATKCFQLQPQTGGVEPPEEGPRSREWWYNEAFYTDLDYYNYFMQQTINGYVAGPVPVWCRVGGIGDAWVAHAYPSTPLGGAPIFICGQYAGDCHGIIKKPANATILYVNCVESLDGDINPVANFIRVFSINTQWSWDTVTWQTRPPLQVDLGGFWVAAEVPATYAFVVPDWVNAVALMAGDSAHQITFMSYSSGAGAYWE